MIKLEAPFLFLSGAAPRLAAVLAVGSMLVACSGMHERVLYYPNGQVRERWHERTVGPTGLVRDGKYESFYPDGSRQALGEYAEGDSAGLWQEWYLNGGNKSEKWFGERGRAKDRSIIWMPGGDTLEIKSFSDQGQLNGRFASFWRDNGELHEQGEYRNDKRHGIWTRWSHSGQIEYGREYDGGRPVGRWVEFGSDGHVASSQEYLRTLPAELSKVWEDALMDGVPVGKSYVFQRHDRQVDTIAADQRDYGELQKKGLDWIVPFKWHSPRFGAIERQRFDTLYIWKHRERF